MPRCKIKGPCLSECASWRLKMAPPPAPLEPAPLSLSLSTRSRAAMKPVAIALDWTPNTNHAGFYVAKAKGFYAEAGLDVELLSPHVDGYKETPASKLTSGQAHFAVTPSETVVSFHTNKAEAKPKIVAVATLLQVRCAALRCAALRWAAMLAVRWAAAL